MSTKYYLQNSSAPVSPSATAYWTEAQFNQESCGTSPNTNSIATQSNIHTNAGSNTLTTQYIVSNSLSYTGQIGGTFQGQIQSNSLLPSGYITPAFAISLVSSSGTFVASLYEGNASSLSVPNETTGFAPLINRSFNGTLTTILNNNSGNYLMIEIGFTCSAGTSRGTGFYHVGSDSSYSDLPVDNTTTSTSYNPWIEFSQTLY